MLYVVVKKVCEDGHMAWRWVSANSDSKLGVTQHALEMSIAHPTTLFGVMELEPFGLTTVLVIIENGHFYAKES